MIVHTLAFKPVVHVRVSLKSIGLCMSGHALALKPAAAYCIWSYVPCSAPECIFYFNPSMGTIQLVSQAAGLLDVAAIPHPYQSSGMNRSLPTNTL